MHSIPPLVTISSSRAGRRALQARHPRSRGSRARDGRPSLGPYCSATPGSSAITRAAISPSTSVWNVAMFGNPPVIAEHAGRRAGEDRGELRAAPVARPEREALGPVHAYILHRAVSVGGRDASGDTIHPQE